ncbi:hypothetical protein D3C74_326870 [compost metagenome]
MDGHAVAARVLDAAQHQDLGPARRHVEHLLVGDAVDLAGRRHDARVRGEHAVDVGVDLAHVGAQAGRERDRRGVRAAATEGRHVVGALRDALEPGDDRDRALLDRLADAVRHDVDDVRLAVHGVRDHAGLLARERLGLDAEVVDRHRQQRHRDALACREQDVHLALGGKGGDLLGEIDELVRRVTHGRDHDDHVMSGPLGLCDALRHPLDALRISYRRATIFLHDKCH